MSNRAANFVEQWVSENAVKPVEGASAGDDSESRLRAEACLAAAKDEGIAREDIEEETGDLVAYMGAVIANLVNHPEQGALSTDENREALIRTRAFYIWLDEGCPEGRADTHWQMATELVAAEEGRVGLAPKPVTTQPSQAPTQPSQARRKA
jgi:Protein of unknown function (DUF2934)